MSFKNYKRSVIIDYNYDEVKKGVPETNKQMAILNSEFRKTSAVIGETGTAMDKMQAVQDTMTNKVKIQTDKIKTLEKEISELDATDAKHAKRLRDKTIELNNAETTLIRYEKQLREANREIEQHQGILGKATLKYKDLAMEMERNGYSMEDFQRKVERTSAVLAGVGVASIKMAGDLDQVMAKTATIADLNQVSLKDLRKGVLEVSRTYNIASTEIAEGLYNINSGNIETSESLILLEDSARLAKAGFTDMGTSAKLLTQIINAYGLEVGDAGLLTDQLIKMQKLGQITVGEFGDQFGRLAGLASTAKIPLEEIMGSVSTLTALASEPAEAITALRAVLSQVIKPSQQAKEAAKEYGVQLSLSALQAKGLAGWLEHLKTRTRGSDEAMTEMFGNINALNSIFLLTGEGASKLSEDIIELGSSAGYTDEALLQLNTDAEKFSSAMNELKIALIEAGDSLSPFLKLATAFLEVISKIPPKVIALVAGLGIVVTVIIQMGKVITSLNTSAKVLGGVFGVTVNPALLKTVGIITLLTAGLITILTLIAAITGKAKDVGNITQELSGLNKEVQNKVGQSATRTNTQVRGSYERGTTRVPADGKYMLHAEEEIISRDDPRNSNHPDYNKGGNGDIYVTINANELQQVTDLVRMFEELKRNKRMGGVNYG